MSNFILGSYFHFIWVSSYQKEYDDGVFQLNVVVIAFAAIPFVLQAYKKMLQRSSVFP